MKNRSVIGVSLLIVVAVVVWIWLSHNRQPPLQRDQAPGGEMATNMVAGPRHRVAEKTNQYKPWTRPPGVDDAGWKYLSMVRELMLQENQPVEFYARVVDQNQEPVVGARLELRLSRVDVEKVLAKFPHMKMGEEQVNETNILYSDTRGWIQLKGISGHFLNVWGLSREGYTSRYLPGFGGIQYKTTTAVEIGHTRALGGLTMDAVDSNRGYTFRLWKKGETERLVPIRFGVCIPENTHQAWFSLFNGQISDPAAAWADFSIVETMLHPEDRTKQYDRTITIQGLHGARLMETSEAYPYLAAERGYRPEYAFDVLPSTGYGPQGTWDWSKNFYVMARDGRVFSGLRIDFVGGKLCFSFNGYLNPAGSRDLEPDPEKLITDPEEIRRIDEQTRVR
jgi:hypothetical protein